MTSPDSNIRTYLQSLTILEAGIGSDMVPIYDRVPEALDYPFVYILDINNVDMSTADQTIWDVDLLLDVVTGYDNKGGGRKSADAIGNNLLTALLDDPYQDIGEYYIAKATMVNSNYLDEDAGDSYIVRKLIRINLQIELIITTPEPEPVGTTPTLSGYELFYLDNQMTGVSLLVNANGANTTTQIEYANNILLTGPTTVAGDAVTGSVNTIVGFITTRLTPGKYYYRVSATNANGTTTGNITPFVIYPGVGRDLVDYSTILAEGIATMNGTTYYIDPSAATNGNGLTELTPFNTWTTAGTLGGNNQYLQKRGSTYNSPTGTFRTFNGPCYMGVYGTGTDWAYIVAGTNSGSDYISSAYRLIIEGYDIKGYRSAGVGTELGRGIRLSSAESGATMNHIVYNCNIHRFRTGIDGYMSNDYYYGMKVLHCEIYEIGLDGIYPQGPTDIELAYIYMHDVNNVWFVNEDDGTSSGDGIQIGFANGSFTSIHLLASVHHNTIDRSATRNKFCIIWNEQENGEAVSCYNNHFICPDYATDTAHPVSAIYTSMSTANDADINTALIYNNLFEGGNYGIRNYTRAGTEIHHNIFIGLYIGIASGGGLGVNVYNNIFKDYTSVALGMGSNPRVTSKNNCFHTSTAAAYAYATIAGLAASDYNNFYNTRINTSAYGLTEWKAEQVHDDHSIDTDPLYVNSDNFDYQVEAASPLIDSGVDVGLTTDRKGTAIPQRTTFDIGVFETV